MSAWVIRTVVKGEPRTLADCADFEPSSGPEPSSLAVNEGIAWPWIRLVRPSTVVESSPPEM